MNSALVIFAPLVGLLGVGFGAWLQAHLTRKNNTNSKLAELQNNSYSDFLNSASAIAVAQRAGNRARVDAELAILADAKARICVYGHAAVIQELAKFIRAGGTLQTESEILSFTRLCICIRKSVGMGNELVALPDISQLLFSVEVSNVPTPIKTDC
ncbi:hypothetical protein [Uliginosibacterium sp. TH139]|uniref:hypothetical protein n=1 Tax=Uliginosibacterium sp. TH139 TaxID=2067453 RepID=UPI000C7D5993|nr:hypothetical protein [Uliginosibacterium sp. TH139]PLK49480.1 hypothetical protein C0V76_09865 [Uliginosibacterium sp. TH139]